MRKFAPSENLQTRTQGTYSLRRGECLTVSMIVVVYGDVLLLDQFMLHTYESFLAILGLQLVMQMTSHLIFFGTSLRHSKPIFERPFTVCIFRNAIEILHN